MKRGASSQILYIQNDQPLVFTDRTGRETEVSSFGIRKKDECDLEKLRQQPKVLYRKRGTGPDNPSEFIVDLDGASQPNQIILALIEPKSTLAKTVVEAEKKTGDYSLDGENIEGSLDIKDVLLVPDIAWNITHHFAELEGRMFKNAQLKEHKVQIVQQDIAFSLNKNGAELRSISFFSLIKSAPFRYTFNRPFLLYMKKRGATQPYFAMWVENAELLAKWKPETGNEASSPSK